MSSNLSFFIPFLSSTVLFSGFPPIIIQTYIEVFPSEIYHNHLFMHTCSHAKHTSSFTFSSSCQSPALAARESAWRDELVLVKNDVASDSRYRTTCLFQAQVFFYTLTKALGQRFDIFSFPHPDLLPLEIIVALQTEFLLQWFSQNQL